MRKRHRLTDCPSPGLLISSCIAPWDSSSFRIVRLPFTARGGLRYCFMGAWLRLATSARWEATPFKVRIPRCVFPTHRPGGGRYGALVPQSHARWSFAETRTELQQCWGRRTAAPFIFRQSDGDADPARGDSMRGCFCDDQLLPDEDVFPGSRRSRSWRDG